MVSNERKEERDGRKDREREREKKREESIQIIHFDKTRKAKQGMVVDTGGSLGFIWPASLLGDAKVLW